MSSTPATRRSLVAGLVLVALSVAGTVAGVLSLGARLRATAPGEDALLDLQSAERLAPYEWLYPYKQAELLQRMGRRKEAADLYHKALSLNRACAVCWIGLAEVAQATGENPEPYLHEAVRFGRANTLVRKRAAVVYAMMGRSEDSAREFRAAVAGRIDDRFEFYRLLSRIFSIDRVLQEIIPDEALESYFAYARRELPPDRTRAVWERYRRGQVRERARDAYVAYLLSYGLVAEARGVGLSGGDPMEDRILDPDFEDPAVPARLGWVLKDGEGVRVRIVPCADCPDHGHALRVVFDGEHNVSFFGVRQSVPVTGGARYRLSARVKSREITSARGPALFVSGATGRAGAPTADCKLYVWGEEIRLTTPWHKTSLEFTVPEACRGVRVHVARGPTKRLNKFIGGTLWVDDVRLERLPAAPEQAAEQAARAGAGT